MKVVLKRILLINFAQFSKILFEIGEQLSDECQTGLAFYLRPNKRLVSEYVPRLNLKEYVDETLAVPGLPAAIESMKTTVAQSVPLSDRKYPKVIFLGTGSAIPNKTRNTSAILVETRYMKKIISCVSFH